MFTSDDIGPWVQETNRNTARATLAKVLEQEAPSHVQTIASLQVGLPIGMVISDEQDALEALYRVTEAGLEWHWDGKTLRLEDMRTKPAAKVSPVKL